MACEDEVNKSLELASRLLASSNAHETDCESDDCLVLSGVIRDCAYRIYSAAAHWRQRHTAAVKGEDDPRWNGDV